MCVIHLRDANLFSRILRYVNPTKWQRFMSDLVSLVMEAAAPENVSGRRLLEPSAPRHTLADESCH
jgi:hypothetical protein